jgi:hypothetical protein
LGGFNSHLVDSRKPKASTPTKHSDHDEFIDNLDELLIPDLVRQIEKMSVSNTTSTYAASELVGSNINRSKETTQSKSLSDLEEDLDLLLKAKDMGASRGALFLTTTWTPMKSTHQLVLHLQAKAEEDSETREPLLVRGALLLTTTRNPMTTPNHFRAIIWV